MGQGCKGLRWRNLVATQLAMLALMGGLALALTERQDREQVRPHAVSFTPGITTLAGSGAGGFVDGPAATATFTGVTELGIDPTGQWLFALDTGWAGSDPHIRKISTTTGAVSTFAQGGLLDGPQDLTVDPAGNVWVSVKLSSTLVCDSDGLANDGQRGIIMYPATGGAPQVKLSGLGCDYYGGAGRVGGAFGFDATGENLFFLNVRGTDNGYTNYPWQPNIRSVPVSELPLSDSYVPGTSTRPAGHPVTDWGGRGGNTRGEFSDVDLGSDGKMYVLWGGTQEGPGSSGENLYRLDAPGSLTLVIPRRTTGEHSFAFSKTSPSVYSYCKAAGNNNGCSGEGLVLRRGGFGTGAPFHLAGDTAFGWSDGYPGKLANNDKADVVLSPDGTRLFVADTGNKRVRVLDVPPDPASLTPEELLCGCNPGEKNLSSPTRLDPVSVATGNLTETFTDLAVPGRGIDLAVRRTYNSLFASKVGWFGRGWSSPLDTRLVKVAPNHIVIEQENGAHLPFSLKVDGTWAGPPRVTSTLTKTASTWTLVRDNRETLTFDDTTGRVTSFKDHNGYVTSLTYSAGSIVMTDPALRTLTFTLNGNRITSVADSTRPGRNITYTYTDDRLTSVTSFKMNDSDATPVTWSYGYELAEPRRLTTITNPRGHSNLTQYRTDGRVEYQVDFAGKRSDLAYGGSGLSTWTTVTYPSNNAAGTRPVERFEFTNLLKTSHTTGYGTSSARTWTFEYDPGLMALTKVFAPGGTLVQETEYDPATGNVTRTVDGEGRETVITDFDPFNNPRSVTGPDGVTTTHTYDANGNLLTTSRPIKEGTAGSTGTALTTLVRSDPAHPDDVTEIIEPRHHGTLVKTLLQYEAATGLVTQVQDGEGNVTKYDYDDSGHLIEVIEPEGNKTGGVPANHDLDFEVNDFGLVEEATDQLGRTTSYVYDKAGNRTSVVDPQETVGTVYDNMGRPIQVNRPGGSNTETAYFDDGSLKAHIDAGDKSTTYTYNPHRQVETMTVPTPTPQTTTYDYDARGRLSKLIAPGGSCPSTNCTSYLYNDADELTNVDYSDPTNPDVTYVLDPVAMTKTMTDGAGTSTWQFDSLGRLRSYDDAASAPVLYQYYPSGQSDKGGMQPRVVTYASGKTVTLGLDDADRVETLAAWAGGTTTFGYDTNSNLQTINTAATTAVEDDFDYDATNRMIQALFKGRTAPGGAAVEIAKLNWTTPTPRDTEGMVKSVTGTGALDTADDTYGYSGLDMLNADSAGTFGYDAADNLSAFPDGRKQKFNDAHQLCYQAPTNVAACGSAPAGATTYGYDDRGNRTTETDAEGTAKSLSYDQANRLVKAVVRDPDAQGQFHALTPPVRVLDTRTPTGTCYNEAGSSTVACSKLVANTISEVQVAGVGGVPADAAAVVLNVTVINGNAGGYLGAYPAGLTPPESSTINFSAATAIANSAITKVGANGRIGLKASTGVDVILDVVGWYNPPTGAAGAEFVALNPARVIDTRPPPNNTGLCPTTACTPLVANTTKNLQITGSGGVPSGGVNSVVLNLTITGQTGSGFATVWKEGTTKPATSNINYSATGGRSVLVTVPVSSTGRISIQASTATDAIFDVAGYYKTGEDTGSVFVPANPARILDTRDATGVCDGGPCDMIPLGGTLTFKVTGEGGVPAGVSAVVLNVTSTGSTAAGYFSLCPGPGACPANLSQLSYSAGQTVAGAVIVPVGADGKVRLYSQKASEAIVDINGWFSAEPTKTWTYSYSGDGLRRSKTGPDGTTITYTWDRSRALPLLLAETIDVADSTSQDRTIRYLYDPTGHVLGDITTQGASETIRWYHHDQLGSTVATTDSAGLITGAFSYSPYGESEGSAAGAPSIGWAGEYKDPETGYVYLRARHYDPATGQFLTRDPLEALTREPYQYAGNNPSNRTDPTGLCSKHSGLFGKLRDVTCEIGEGDVGEAADRAAAVGAEAYRLSPGGSFFSAASQLTGHSVGACAGGNLFGGYDLMGSLCYMATPDGRSGFTATGGGGGAAPWGVAGLVGLSVSNAEHECDFDGGSAYGWASVGAGKLGGGVAGSRSDSGIWQTTVGWSPGFRTGQLAAPGPYAFGGGASYTWTFGW